MLEEALYDPLLPVDQQGVGAWNRRAPTARKTSLGNNNNNNTGGLSNNPRPRKLRPIASAKLGGQNEGIWDDIVGLVGEPTTADRTARPAIQQARSFASEITLRQELVTDGFLTGCYFLMFGFTAKEVRFHITRFPRLCTCANFTFR